jgi:hypothetical protein
VISVITITGIGDHLQPVSLITFTGMRNLITAAALAHPKSAVWAGYWHREKAA